MKLKYIEISRHGLLVDESAEIKENDWCVNIGRLNEIIIPPDNIIGKADYTAKVLIGSSWRKIICAEKELNLDLPILPNWRGWEVRKEANELRSRGSIIKHPDPNTNVFESGLYQGFIAGYNYNKAKYTEEQLFSFLDNEDNHTEGELGYPCIDISAFKYYIKSLQKVPKYIVLESNTIVIGHTGTQNIFGETLKLATNSEGKQEVIIKEIIY